MMKHLFSGTEREIELEYGPIPPPEEDEELVIRNEDSETEDFEYDEAYMPAFELAGLDPTLLRLLQVSDRPL